MDYWRCEMNWPIDSEWRCEVCGWIAGLTWGFAHGECQCDRCHAVYTMRPDGEIVTVPVCRIKPDWMGATKRLWEEHGIFGEEATDEQWVAAGIPPELLVLQED